MNTAELSSMSKQVRRDIINPAAATPVVPCLRQT